MGGPGSGRPPLGDKAVPVEDCLTIDATRVVRRRRHKVGRWEWLDGFNNVLCSLRYELYTEDARGWLTLDYKVGTPAHRLSYSVPLQTTFPHFGGVRWWFTCPLTVEGQYCGRRVRKLYLPPGERFFGCRSCHRLSYASSQSHDKRLSALVRRLLSGEVSLTDAENGPLGLRLAMHMLDRIGGWRGESLRYERDWQASLDIPG
jgi:hypothetical protein